MPKAKQYIWNEMGEHLLIIQLYIPILVFELLFRPIFVGVALRRREHQIGKMLLAHSLQAAH